MRKVLSLPDATQAKKRAQVCDFIIRTKYLSLCVCVYTLYHIRSKEHFENSDSEENGFVDCLSQALQFDLRNANGGLKWIKKLTKSITDYSI